MPATSRISRGRAPSDAATSSPSASRSSGRIKHDREHEADDEVRPDDPQSPQPLRRQSAGDEEQRRLDAVRIGDHDRRSSPRRTARRSRCRRGSAGRCRRRSAPVQAIAKTMPAASRPKKARRPAAARSSRGRRSGSGPRRSPRRRSRRSCPARPAGWRARPAAARPRRRARRRRAIASTSAAGAGRARSCAAARGWFAGQRVDDVGRRYAHGGEGQRGDERRRERGRRDCHHGQRPQHGHPLRRNFVRTSRMIRPASV